MSRGYNKAFNSRKGSVHASIQFDKLFNENTNRPSAVRSAGTVGKWGITSFTSIRSANGLGLIHREEVIPQKCVRTVSGDQNTRVSSSDPFAFESTTNNSIPVPKPKKFFKSRNPDPVDVSGIRSDAALYTKKTDYTYGAAKRSKLNHKEESETKTVTRNSNKKVLCSKNTQSSSNVRVSILSPNSKRTDKPPIVLRISKGKSRLLSDSDEAPDPVPVPPKSPSHGRVTRSSCRNNSADAESHSDSNHDLIPSLFTSPRGGELQYIPAEKYELERKAIYENLLGGSSPISTVHKLSVEEVTSASTSHVEPQIDELTEDKGSEETVEPEQVEKAPVEVESTSESQEKVQDNMDSDSDTPSENLPEQAPKSPQSITEDKPEENTAPPVKLVISKKKGRVFKSRSLLVEGSKKRHALYKHKWCDDKDATSQKLGTDVPDNSKPSSGDAPVYEEMDLEGEQLTRVTHWPGESADLIDEPEIITSIKCAKKAKGFYTVVRNVKKAHQIQEIGEFQEFNDDVDYILDALQDNNPNSTRCLSAITLASKCMTPAFRMHLRAHGTVAKFFKALHDATKDQSLGLCTATVMFVLSQDRLNMDLDRDCLELMLNLLESDVSHRNALNDCGMSSAQLRKNKEKVRELCAEIQGQGHAMHLDLDNITVGHLAMETLLSLTSKRAGEWFKEELRELGGLEHIIKTICDCCNQIFENSKVWTDTILDKLRKVERCLRVLENVTHINEENQTYILKYKNGVVVDTLVKLYRLCDSEMPSYPVTDLADKESTGVVIREAVLVTLKVLINLTHHFNSRSTGCALVGERPGIIDASLHLLLRVPNYIPEQKKFELSVLVLMLLINLIQHDDNNKKLLMDAKEPEGEDSIFPSNKTAVEALIDQFYSREQLARVAEQRTNAILDGDSTLNSAPENMSHEEFIGETMDKLIQKAGTHMEHTMIGSYIVLLLGYLIMNNKEYENKVRMLIAPHNFTDMHTMLVKFFNFMYLTASGEAVSICHIKATEKVIKYLEKCDKEQPKENKSLDIDMELS